MFYNNCSNHTQYNCCCSNILSLRSLDFIIDFVLVSYVAVVMRGAQVFLKVEFVVFVYEFSPGPTGLNGGQGNEYKIWIDVCGV